MLSHLCFVKLARDLTCCKSELFKILFLCENCKRMGIFIEAFNFKKILAFVIQVFHFISIGNIIYN